VYRFIVKQKVRVGFAALSRGEYEPALSMMAEDCRYRFVGAHALSGSRSNRALIEQWFQRYMRVLPGFQFRVAKIVVEGWPWNTGVALRLDVSWKAPDGTVYENVALQMIELRWFKAVNILTVDDTRGFSDLLEKVATVYGVAEAAAAPIEG